MRFRHDERQLGSLCPEDTLVTNRTLSDSGVRRRGNHLTIVGALPAVYCKTAGLMESTRSVTAEQSGAFVETIELSPTAGGPLARLGFAVKDVIDVAGRLTGCGNPTWRDTHPPAAVQAVCVEQLLAAGAHCVGKTVTDELAFRALSRWL